jgi:NAD-dependent SIR2 family protein deacetylase
MTHFFHHCFVCGKETDPQNMNKNKQLNLPVCTECSGTKEEEKAVDDLIEGMADGFVCGCI